MAPTGLKCLGEGDWDWGNATWKRESEEHTHDEKTERERYLDISLRITNTAHGTRKHGFISIRTYE